MMWLAVNFCFMGETPETVDEAKDLTEDERQGVKRAQEFKTTGAAYALEHATRPATIGFALQSSPVAFFAWYDSRAVMLGLWLSTI